MTTARAANVRPVIDLHCDSVLAHVQGKRDLRQRSAEGHLDFPRMRAGGVNGQIFAIWVDPAAMKTGEYVPYVLKNLDAVASLFRDATGDAALVRDPEELETVVASGRIAGIPGVEGGHALKGDPGNLDLFHERGARVMTVTWCNSNELADSSSDENRPNNGLSRLGRDVIRRMNDLGMVVDVSHSSPKAVLDIVEASRAPVMASHSGVEALRRFNRNLSDEEIRAIGRSGGVVGVIFLPYFLREREEEASISEVLDCIDHVVQLAGPEAAGLGSDFDGFEGRLRGLEDVSKAGSIRLGLRERGYSETDLNLILGGNFLRVWNKVHQLRRA